MFVFMLEIVKRLNEQIDILELIDAETLSNGIDFDLKLLFEALSTAPLQCFVVDEVFSLINQKLENVFDAFVLVLDLAMILVTASHVGLVVVVIKFAAALALVLAVHDGCVLVHLRFALGL